ncbi:MAG TPA: hypothetical protein VEK73_21500 [Xanthobacteraceae bacterium]|nr:hypothetical protein [Xanthobacteraceae bacterium]
MNTAWPPLLESKKPRPVEPDVIVIWALAAVLVLANALRSPLAMMLIIAVPALLEFANSKSLPVLKLNVADPAVLESLKITGVTLFSVNVAFPALDVLKNWINGAPVAPPLAMIFALPAVAAF